MSTLVGTGSLVRLILRRDRIRLPVWLVAILGLVYASASAVKGTYNTPADIAAYGRTVGNSPASIAFNGPPTALDTIAGIVVFEVSATAILTTALMAIFLVVRHTRGEEQDGRTELVRATVVGRYAPFAAALLVVSVASLVVGVGLVLALLALDLPAAGALGYGASVAVIGIVFTAVGACAAQVTEHARGALGIALAVLGVSYVLRGAGDVGNGTLSWLSPIGWAQAVRPFADDRWWPLLLPLALVVVLLAVTGTLLSHRDVGAGLVAPRPGPPTASPRLSGPVGLAVRLQRGSILGWAIGMLFFGVALGSVGREVEELLKSIPELADALDITGGADIVDAFFSTAMLILALVAAGFTVSSALRLRGDETSGRAEPLLATSLSRSRWTLGSLLVTVVGTVLVIAAGGFGAGLAHAVTTGDIGQLPRLLLVSLVYAPAALVLAGAAVLLFGWAPRLALVSWGLLAVCFVIGWLGGVLEIPVAVTNLSPYTHVPAAPADPVAAGPLLALTAVGLALVAAGVLGFRRRDVG